MGIASEKFGYLLIPILLKQLPQNLVVEFHRKRNPDNIGDVNELMKFIKFEIESREAANAVSGLSMKTHEPFRPKIDHHRNKNQFKTNFPTSAALNTVVKNTCHFCNSNLHTGLECKVLTNEQKRYKLKKEGRCYKCFFKHLQSACKVKIKPCETCESTQHNHLFCPQTKCKKVDHNPKSDLKEISPPENETVLTSLHESKKATKNICVTLLQTACVQVESEDKNLIARILYDSASSRTFIRRDLAKALNAKFLRKEKLFIYTFSNRYPTESELDCVQITLRSRFFPYKSITIEALITNEICGTKLISNVNPQLLQNMKIQEYEFADLLDINKPIQLLLGANFLFKTINGSIIKISKHLFIQSTIFGDTLVGQIASNHLINSDSCLTVITENEDNDLRNLWAIENFLSNKENKLHPDDLSAFESNLKFVNERYECPLLWKSNSLKDKLNNNLENAWKRFMYLEKRFNSDESFFLRYNEVMKEQLDEGIIAMCDINSFNGYTMPHQAVFRQDSHSSKTRIVYDASSKIGNNLSLNDCLLSGENLNADLLSVILKFRVHKIGFCGDIARAFLQIQVSESDRNYLRFLYYKDCDKTQPIVEYQFLRHVFGSSCSPYILAATIKTHIKAYEMTHPLAYEMLSNSLYVDDLFYGSSTIPEAFQLSVDAVSILKDANMHMRKFDSNSEELKKLWKNSNPPIELNEQNDTHLKVLGLNWYNHEDTLGVNLNSLLSNSIDLKCTKRNVLHTAAKIFDPSGIFTPFTIRLKCLLQELWQLGLGWDEEFSGEIKDRWIKCCSEIEELQTIRIPRYYFPELRKGENIELHVFSDASLKSFGAVAYFRYKTDQNTFNTSFIISKARVTPLKRLTLPRLELMGAVIAARLVKHLMKIFEFIEKIVLWSDSTIVLHWLKGTPSKWKQFIANRVIEIQEITDPSAWKHCIGKDNPADLLTRGLSSKELTNCSKWWHGPEWLTAPENIWPKTKFYSVGEEIESEYRSKVIVNSAIVSEKIIDPNRFSSLKRLLRVTAWVLRFVDALKRKRNYKDILTSEELSKAEQYWIKVYQNEFYSDEINCLKNGNSLNKESKLLCLHPFLDSENILRVSGRLQKTQLSMDEKHPIILPSKSKLTELLIWNSHEKVFHSSVSHTLVQLREKFWIIKARQTIKSLLRKCVICKRFNSSPGDQMIAPLPADRAEQSAPFSVIGVDYAGPLFVKDTDNKLYILLITCAVTRSVHLELVGNLSTETFLLAFRRFTARRGLPSIVISDNARTFKRAEIELKQLWSIMNHQDVKNYYASNSIKWKYIVERAPWWGGFYERMVRTVKVALRKTLGKSSLTVDQLHTVLLEIEGMINSRPITYAGSDVEEPTALTPAHILLGKRITSLPPVRLHLDPNFSSRKIFIKAFNYRERLLRLFWARWKKEYLLNLRSVHSSLEKDKINQFKVNDVVIIKEDHLPRNFWKLGRILEVFPGRDGKVRSCKLKTESSVIKRPVQLLYNLELQD